jgi:stage II sporulation protein AA (anti-sigma F factor antagonist)
MGRSAVVTRSSITSMREELPGPDLLTALQPGEDGVVLRVEGEVDLVTAPALAMALAEATAEPGDVTVDLRQVTFMDSTGLRVLLETRERLDQDGRAMRLQVDESGAVARLLDLVGVRALFRAD